MVHDEYRPSENEVTAWVRQFDWSLRRTVQLTPLIMLDERIVDYYGESSKALIREEVDRIAAEHEAPPQRVEVIPYEWGLDQNINSILIKWTSEYGVFRREFRFETKTQHHLILVPDPLPINRERVI